MNDRFQMYKPASVIIISSSFSLFLPTSTCATFTFSITTSCLRSHPGRPEMASGGTAVSQHNAPHSPIMHPLPCETEQRGVHYVTCLLLCVQVSLQHQCVPTHPRWVPVLLLVVRMGGEEDEWMNDFTVRCRGKRSGCLFTPPSVCTHHRYALSKHKLTFGLNMDYNLFSLRHLKVHYVTFNC